MRRMRRMIEFETGVIVSDIAKSKRLACGITTKIYFLEREGFGMALGAYSFKHDSGRPVVSRHTKIYLL
jgi:hypothetical protein